MKKLIADRLEIEEEKITPDSSFRQDLGADSLDTYELVYAIEEEMGITIPDEKASPRAPPSRSAKPFSRTSLVGFIERV